MSQTPASGGPRHAPPSVPARVRTLLQRVAVRLALSALILLSLLPFEAHRTADRVFLVVFGVEFILRLIAVFGAPASDGANRHRLEDSAATRRRLGQVAFLAVDLLALLSFVPWDLSPDEGRWLRLFRLTRMLLLVGYWSPLVRDFWTVLSRRERARQVVLMGLVVLFLAFAGAAILEHLAASGVDFDGDGALGAGDSDFFTRFWWSFRQIQDPGNMLATPGHAAALAVSVLLTVSGLLLVSFLIGLGADVVRELVELSRARPVDLRDHFVLVHVTPELPRLIQELTAYHDKLFRRVRFAVVGEAEDPPPRLLAPDLAKVHYRAFANQGGGTFVERADVARAKRVVVLSHADVAHPDAHTASIVLAAREANDHAWIAAEVLEQSNASAMRVAGGDRTVLVPTEKFLALYVTTALRHPERLGYIEELMTSRRGSEIYTYYYDYDPTVAPGAPVLPTVAPDFDGLYIDGITSPPGERVVPIGLIYAGALEDRLTLGGRDPVSRGTEDGHATVTQPIRGVVALGTTFTEVASYARRLVHRDFRRAGGLTPAALDRALPALAPAPQAPPITRALICGFRPAAVDLAAALMAAYPAIEIHLLVAHNQSYQAAMKALTEHAIHIRAGLWREHGPWGTFEPSGGAPDAFAYHPRGVGPATGHLSVHVADWTSEQTLLSLPGGGAHLGTVDVAILLGGLTADVDWQTAMTVLKIADIVRAHPERFTPSFQVVAGVRDPDLGRRLADSYARTVGDATAGVRVFATEQLRALFTFQTVAVPGFDVIYSELLNPWGCGFCRLELTPQARAARDEYWTFVDLALGLRRRGWTLVALERDLPEGGTERLSAPSVEGAAALIAQRDIACLWVLKPETPE